MKRIIQSVKDFLDKFFSIIPAPMFFTALITFVISIFAVIRNINKVFSLIQCVIVLVASAAIIVYTILPKKIVAPKFMLAGMYVLAAALNLLMLYKTVTKSNNLLLFKNARVIDAVIYGAVAALFIYSTYLIVTNTADSPFIFSSIISGLVVSSIAFVVPYLNIVLLKNPEGATLILSIVLFYVSLIFFDLEFRYMIIAEDPKTKLKLLNNKYKKGLLTEEEYKTKLEAI